MKDEEMAEKKYCNGCKWRIEQCLWAWRNTNGLKEPNEKNCSCKEVPAFFVGLKAGRPQWHDLRKDPNDLPKENSKVYLYAKDKEYYMGYLENRAWKYDGGFYASDNFVIAWCEIPTFDKEEEDTL